jgi:hypothetical protein
MQAHSIDMEYQETPREPEVGEAFRAEAVRVDAVEIDRLGLDWALAESRPCPNRHMRMRGEASCSTPSPAQAQKRQHWSGLRTRCFTLAIPMGGAARAPSVRRLLYMQLLVAC